MAIVDIEDLQRQVRTVYQRVAERPDDEFHFRMGRGLAEDLGYRRQDLDRVPSEAVRSFAGVGYYFDLAQLAEGEKVLDLGSGSGMDTFLAAAKVGGNGHVIGLDMTDEQLEKADAMRAQHGFDNVSFRHGFIERLPLEDASVDVVISNGVINLSAEKPRVFEEIARVLRPGGRLAIADIVSEKQLGDDIVCDPSLWAACIGGAAQLDSYRDMITRPGMRVQEVRDNDAYAFLSKSAQGASREYGVKSVSVSADRTDETHAYGAS